MRSKISIGFLFVAMFLSLAHAVLPHHHHGNLICFNPNCLETCCCHDAHEHDAHEAAHCACNHHHHDADECTIFAPYVMGDDGRDISLRISLNNSVLSFFYTALISVPDMAPQPALTGTIVCDQSAPPVPTAPFSTAEVLRGPPCRA